jgi:hypothetical protein
MPRVRTVKKKPVSDKQRAEDDKLREELRNFDLKKFDKALEKAINPKKKAV